MNEKEYKEIFNRINGSYNIINEKNKNINNNYFEVYFNKYDNKQNNYKLTILIKKNIL